MNEHTFKFEPLFRAYGRILLVLLGLVGLFALFIIVPAVSLGMALVIFGSTAVLFLFGFYLYWRHSGLVKLSQDSVQIHRAKRVKSVCFEDVVAVQLSDFNLPPNFILKTEHQKLKISHRLTSFPLFYYRLRAKLPLLRKQEVVAFPFQRHMSRMYRGQTIIGSVLYLLLVGGLVFGIIFGLGNFAAATLSAKVIVLGVMGLTIVIACIPLYAVLAKEKSAGFTATEETFQLHTWRGGTTPYEIKEIKRIYIEARENLLRVVPKQAFNDYIIMVEFKNGEAIWFDESHARKWQSSVEMLFFNLFHLYKHTPINFHILTQQIYY